VSGVDDRSGRWGWRLTSAVTVLVYIFLFATRKRGSFTS